MGSNTLVNIHIKMKLKVIFQPEPALNDILPAGLSFDLETRVNLICGPNNSGKTAFLRMLSQSLENSHTYNREQGAPWYNYTGLGVGERDTLERSFSFHVREICSDCLIFDSDMLAKMEQRAARLTALGAPPYDLSAFRLFLEECRTYVHSVREKGKVLRSGPFYSDVLCESVDSLLKTSASNNSIELIKVFVAEDQETGKVIVLLPSHGYSHARLQNEFYAKFLDLCHRTDIVARTPFTYFGLVEIEPEPSECLIFSPMRSIARYLRRCLDGSGHYREDFSSQTYFEFLMRKPERHNPLGLGRLITEDLLNFFSNVKSDRSYLVLLDEPTNFLDEDNKHTVISEINRLIEQCPSLHLFIATNDATLISNRNIVSKGIIDLQYRPAQYVPSV